MQVPSLRFSSFVSGLGKTLTGEAPARSNPLFSRSSWIVDGMRTPQRAEAGTNYPLYPGDVNEALSQLFPRGNGQAATFDQALLELQHRSVGQTQALGVDRTLAMVERMAGGSRRAEPGLEASALPGVRNSVKAFALTQDIIGAAARAPESRARIEKAAGELKGLLNGWLPRRPLDAFSQIVLGDKDIQAAKVLSNLQPEEAFAVAALLKDEGGLGARFFEGRAGGSTNDPMPKVMRAHADALAKKYDGEFQSLFKGEKKEGFDFFLNFRWPELNA